MDLEAIKEERKEKAKVRRKVAKAVSKKKGAMLAIGPHGMVERITESIDDELLRRAVGKIVWWDLYGTRLVAERTPAFDHWLSVVDSRSRDISNVRIAYHLIRIGYHPVEALRRMTCGNYNAINEEMEMENDE